jgi:NADH-quinone oxidoreductase subunit G
VLRALGGALGLPGFEFTDMPGLRASVAIDKERTTSLPVGNGKEAIAPAADALELAVSDAIYRVDGVTRRAAALQSHPLTLGPRITLHPDDAAALGIKDGVMAKVGNDAGTATLPVATSARVARGAAWIERGYGATAALGAGQVKVAPA